MARNMRFCHFLQKDYGPTDQWTDTASYRNARTHLKMTEDAMLCCLPALMMTMIGTLKSESTIKLVSTRKGHNYLAFLNTGGSTSPLLLSASCNQFDLFLLNNQELFKSASERSRNYRDSTSNK